MFSSSQKTKDPIENREFLQMHTAFILEKITLNRLVNNLLSLEFMAYHQRFLHYLFYNFLCLFIQVISQTFHEIWTSPGINNLHINSKSKGCLDQRKSCKRIDWKLRFRFIQKLILHRETDLAPPMPKKEFGKRCFSYNGAVPWNNLPNEAKIAESLRSFKSILKQRMSWNLLVNVFVY